ncbi:hypothetical protein [Chryseobacterium vrystaatense]|uniref:Uncharacterized protein n=1 Tax=Chryseobacterium vrystaatense TaxID=307480 RepID=A0A1M4UWQ0_9FLAO|nr:hypothetical protein [Chryseobacterium vrystaatense]SHE61060.1 hypothetical protein SAMN02787073_0740 [Chryseobacterium vrystaatense]
MVFIDTLEKVNNFIISKINFQDNEVELNKKYYLLIDDEVIEGDSEHYDFLAINYDQFISQPDIDYIMQKYEALLVSEIDYYQQDFITTVANNFRDCNTELSQKMYYENTILSLKNCIVRFTEKLTGDDDFNIPYNKIQRITINIINDAHSGIINMLKNEYGKHITSVVKIDNLRTIFGLNLAFVEKLYNELKSYDLFNKHISQNDFFKILNIDYTGETKIELKLNSLPDFYYLVRFFKDNFSSKHMLFYKQISTRFLVSTTEKSNISFNSKKISDGISNLNKDVASRVVKRGSEIIAFLHSLEK